MAKKKIDRPNTAEIVRIHKSAKPHLYVNEHFEALECSDTDLGEKMGIDRATVFKWRNRPQRLDTEQLSRLAQAMGLKSHLEFHVPPGFPSLDAMVDEVPGVREHATKVVVELINREKSKAKG